MARDILRGVVGRLLGLDKDDNLILGGTKIYYGHSAQLDAVLDLSAITAGQAPGSVSITLAATVDDLAVAAGFRRLILTPNAGGSTVNGIALSGVVDDTEIEVFNEGASASIAFATEALSSAAANRFKGPSSGIALGPGDGAIARYIVNRWRFVS